LHWWRGVKILYTTLITKLITEFTLEIWRFGNNEKVKSRILKFQGRNGNDLIRNFFLSENKMICGIFHNL